MDAGLQFGSYTLVSRIGAGGMGEVWKAEDPRLRRTVAIKILPHDTAESAESGMRFMREARTAAQLYHPNIATIHAIEEHDGRPFIVMEYVDGEPLSRAIRQGRLTETDVVFIGNKIAQALVEAHAHGIIHRDIKPDNVMVSGQRVKVLDFGIAKTVQPPIGDGGSSHTDVQTRRGVILGTIQYMSPEQAMGKPLDGRSDIFSLGVLLYEAATGRLPFRGETVTDTLTRIIRDEAPDLRVSHPHLSSGLTAAIMKCLAKDREHRFTTASEVAAALDEVLVGSRTARKAPASDLPTAVSVRQSHRQTEMPSTNPASKAPEAVPHRGHGPWPWIFATLLLVVGSVAGTAWYLTRVLRPQPGAAAGPMTSASPLAEVTADTVGSNGTGGSAVSTDAARESGVLPVSVTDPVPSDSEPLDGMQDDPRSRPIPPEPQDDAPVVEQADAWMRRGYWLVARGREAEGVRALERAVTLDPATARAWLPIGVVALRRGRTADASRAFEAALRHSDSMGTRDLVFAGFGASIAGARLEEMNEHCRTAPFDREFAELRRLAKAAGADCGPLPSGTGPVGRGPGPPGGASPRPRP